MGAFSITDLTEQQSDTQREAVYRAEALLWWGRRFGSLREAQDYVDALIATPVWRERRSSMTEVRVVTPQFLGLDPRYGWSLTHAHHPNGTVALPEHGLNEKYVLHELAHLLAQRPGEECHGPRFARTYLALVGLYLGLEHARVLRSYYQGHGVKWRVCSSPDGS